MSASPTPPPMTGLNLRVNPDVDATIVVCTARLTATVAPQFRAHISELVPRTKRVVLDLSALTFMDSSGLGSLVSLYVTAHRGGCGLELINLSRHVRELLGLTNLLSVFESCGQYFTKMP
ncbi:MAG: STAS domain-containing protein [Acidobacteria bacterium]|nr:STAS domain-containing protein [Acidobacteriota bacterium]